MKNKKSTLRYKKRLVLAIGALFILVAIFGALEKARIIDLLHRGNNQQVTSQDGPTTQQKEEADKAAAEAKKNLLEGDAEKGSEAGNLPTTGEQDNTIELTAQQEANNTVTVFTKLPGYSDGTCQLQATNGTKAYTKDAPIVFQREASTCAGFSVPIESLGKGLWSINLSVTSRGVTKNSSTSFEVK
jgi:hypothetical protein